MTISSTGLLEAAGRIMEKSEASPRRIAQRATKQRATAPSAISHVILLFMFFETASNKKTSGTTQKRGWNRTASSKFKRRADSHARVSPHPGHDIPVTNLIGQPMERACRRITTATKRPSEPTGLSTSALNRKPRACAEEINTMAS